MPHVLTPPSPRITTLDQFSLYLEEKGVPEKLRPYFMTAAKERHAWRLDYAHDWQGLEALVDVYGSLLELEGDCAWVSQKGEVIHCQYASHDQVCEVFFGILVADFEKSHARITRRTQSPEDAMHRVARPSRAMRDAVYNLYQRMMA